MCSSSFFNLIQLFKAENLFQHIIQWNPIISWHIFSVDCIINVQFLINVTHKAPMKVVLLGVFLKCIKLIFDLTLNVFGVTSLHTTFSFDNPNISVSSLNDVIRIKEPLLSDTIHIDDRKILLTWVTIFVNLFYTIKGYVRYLNFVDFLYLYAII